MKIGSLFSGAGGLDLAVEHVFNAETVWHCELDPAASRVLAHRWPAIPNHHDITTVDWTTVEPVDIICGGWPCQPFSLAGKQLGAEDDRALWPYVARAVRMVRPRWVVLENVSAVLGPEFSRVANDLAACGYEFGWVCVRASDVGAPHRRERVFILATDTPGFGRQSGEQRGGMGAEHARAGRNQLLPTDASGDGRHEGRPQPARLQRGSDAPLSSDGPVELLPTPTQSDGTGGGRRQSRRRGDNSEIYDSLRDYVCLTTPNQWGKYGPAIARWEAFTRPAPAPTEPNTKGNPRLSAAFSEWLMGWPAGWVTQVPGISRNDQLRIIGNGVCPQQAAAALTWLLNVAVPA